MQDEHKNRTKLFLSVFVMLGLLTLASFAVANSSIMNHPATGWSVMMAISASKAFLVIMFFMHLRWETNWKYVLTIPAAVMSFVLVFMLVPDVAMRTKTYSKTRIQYAPETAHQDEIGHGHVEQEHEHDNTDVDGSVEKLAEEE